LANGTITGVHALLDAQVCSLVRLVGLLSNGTWITRPLIQVNIIMLVTRLTKILNVGSEWKTLRGIRYDSFEYSLSRHSYAASPISDAASFGRDRIAARYHPSYGALQSSWY
jgi:hypothetical protein